MLTWCSSIILIELITNGWALTGKLLLLFSYIYCFFLEIYQKIICGRKQMVHGEQQYTNWQWCSSCCWLVLMGSLTGLRNYFPTPLHHLHPPALWHKAGWLHGFMPLRTHSVPTCVCLGRNEDFWQPCVPFHCLSFQNKNPRWSSTVRAHPPQGST